MICSTLSPLRVSYALLRLAAPKQSLRNYSSFSRRTALLLTTDPSSASSCPLIQLHRNLSFLNNVKKTFKREIEKTPDLKDSFEEIKKFKDSKVGQGVKQTVEISVDKGKGVWTRSKTYISDLSLGNKLLRSFEKTSDTFTYAVSKLPKKIFRGKDLDKEVDASKKADTPSEQTATTTDQTASTEAAKAAEHVQVAKETTQQEVAQEEIKKVAEELAQEIQKAAQQVAGEGVTGQKGEGQETVKTSETNVYDMIVSPLEQEEKRSSRWFSGSKLAQTVERIRVYHPQFSIVEFMIKVNPIHHDFLVALYGHDVEVLKDLAGPEFYERIMARPYFQIEVGKPVSKCHVIELYDAELDSTDPDRLAIKVTFEAQIVMTKPDGTVMTLDYQQHEAGTQLSQIADPTMPSSQVVQMRGAFEWVFDEKNILIHDYIVYTMEPIY